MQADIIVIGDEILIGQVNDTNSNWIAEQLNLSGIKVRQITTVSDQDFLIIDALTDSEKASDLVIITGGLGPTSDDVTKNTLCRYFDSKLVMSDEILADVMKLINKRNGVLNELNRLQAMVPDNCTPLHNPNGTAPGMMFERNHKLIFSLPGVPFEMKALMTEEVMPRVRSYFVTTSILHRTILTFGIGESILAEKISSWEKGLPEICKLAYLPSPGLVRLRLSLRGNDIHELECIAANKTEELKIILQDSIYGYNDDTMEKVVGRLLSENKATLSLAESCTGGKISHLITSVPGSSEYFAGSVIAYSNQVKENILDVSRESLINFGAVSKEVVDQMANGVRNLFQTDYSLATSGIAGPGGGTSEKPVGTTWISVSSASRTISLKFHFGDNRERNIIRASLTALNMLRLMISGTEIR